LTLLLSIPCLVAFLIVPDLIMRALFLRGAFTAADASAAAATLAAYALGLFPFVLIRSMTAPFFARGDTATPVKASLTAAAVNIAFKIALMGPLAQVGLALATAIGAWINLGLIMWFAMRENLIGWDERLKRSLIRLAVAGGILAVLLILAAKPAAGLFAHMPTLRDEMTLAILAAGSAAIYALAVLLLLGRQWLAGFRH
jgi:putative peptidoglycan lipid II flippase